MREAVATHDRWSFQNDDPDVRFEQKPRARKPKRHHHDDEVFDSRCPYCQQDLDHHGMSISNLLTGGVRQLGFALVMIAFAIVRCLRFVAAVVLCVFGFVGNCCRALGLQIAHASDREFLKKL
jgi:hypothetical protein